VYKAIPYELSLAFINVGGHVILPVNFCEVARLANGVFEGRINFGYRLKVRVPFTLLDSPVMFYCRFVNIYTIEMQLNPIIVTSQIRR